MRLRVTEAIIGLVAGLIALVALIVKTVSDKSKERARQVEVDRVRLEAERAKAEKDMQRMAGCGSFTAMADAARRLCDARRNAGSRN